MHELAEGVVQHAINDIRSGLCKNVPEQQWKRLRDAMYVALLSAVMTFAAHLPRPIPQPSAN
jgi:hypothetical protein